MGTCLRAHEGDSGPLVEAHREDEAAGGQEVDKADHKQPVLVDAVGLVLKKVLHLRLCTPIQRLIYLLYRATAHPIIINHMQVQPIALSSLRVTQMVEVKGDGLRAVADIEPW